MEEKEAIKEQFKIFDEKGAFCRFQKQFRKISGKVQRNNMVVKMEVSNFVLSSSRTWKCRMKRTIRNYLLNFNRMEYETKCIFRTVVMLVVDGVLW